MADEIPGTGRDESGRFDAVDRVGPEHISSKLLLHEAGIRPVAVETANDVITIGPGIWP